MKSYAVLAGLFFTLASHAEPPPVSSDQLDKPFIWKGEATDLLGQVPETSEVADNFAGQPDKLSISRNSLFGAIMNPGTYTLRTLGPSIVSQITSRHYAITGTISYRDVQAGSFLELENWFSPEQSGGPESFYFTRTLADAGPMAKIEGSVSGRDFTLPFDATGAKTPLVRLVLKLHFMGGGLIEFSNVRLIEYPNTAPAQTDSPVKAPEIILSLSGDSAGIVRFGGIDYSSADILAALKECVRKNADTSFIIRGTDSVPYANVKQVLDVLREAGARNVFFATSPEASSTASVSGPDRPPGVELRSFGFGVLAAVLTLGAFAALFYLGHRFRKLRHSRELRRIASLDG